MSDGMQGQMGYLDPRVIAEIGSLELRARMVVEGLVTGMHRSPVQGFSVEFAQHRQYAAGDDVRFLDWKVYGKTERLYLKQYHQETNLDLVVMLDVSESMGYAGRGQKIEAVDGGKSGLNKSGKSVVNYFTDKLSVAMGGADRALTGDSVGVGLSTGSVEGRGKVNSGAWGKYDYGATLASAVSYLALRQQDRVALSLLDEDGGKQVTRLSNKQGQWRTIVEQLEQARVGVCEKVSAGAMRSEGKKGGDVKQGEDGEGGFFDRAVRNLTRRSLVVLVSDLYMDVERLREAMARLSFGGHDLIVLQVVDGDEVDFGLADGVELIGLEGEGKLGVDPKGLRKAYMEAVARHDAAIDDVVRGFGYEVLRMRTDERFTGALRKFLSRRGAMVGVRGGR
ncbi:VWA domain containing CoxE-like protein [Poriferisphaera corsica]|uniref:VWA domain containing CoxE-like protein n=1 Tax=Poriferisphaera corsica TaxID=2528020 RepID=A0A517YP46_9BACT|nr:DUF58 domain-containing protein [Poriferisphaera corsica]QDU31983.1 VWA domain containing CoxE-like protein [Poriferisphaera corsica]